MDEDDNGKFRLERVKTYVCCFSEHEPEDGGEPFTFQDMFSSTYQVKNFDAQWIGGNLSSHMYLILLNVELK